jgi:xanthine dehydrogenase accessory factor
MRELLATLTDSLDSHRPCVLCSVVETRGSTPRKAGAAMLVFADGSQAGTLGGGCVEAEVKRKALATLAGDDAPRPDLHTFLLDDNYGWDDGLICGGRMDILADPVHVAERADYFRRYRELVDAGRGCTEAVPTSGLLVGSRYLFGPRGDLVAGLGPTLPPSIGVNLTPLGSRPKPYQKDGIAYLPILARITLLIVGAGHVGQAVADLAGGLDFDVWIVDDRDSFASESRFPKATRRIVGDIGLTLVDLAKELTSDFYALIVTRGHGHDEEALFRLADTACGYVGLIGSKRKIKLIYEDLLAKGISAERLRRVHAPLGLNIGSQTVPEIAVSIVAELIAVRNLGSSIAAARTRVDI